MDYLKYCKISKLKVGSDHSYKMYDMYCGEQAEVATEGKLTMEDFMKAKKALEAAKAPMKAMVTSFGYNMYSPTNLTVSICDTECKKQEVENTMNTNSERDYLSRRLENVKYEQANALRKQFHIDASTNPQTYKELIDWVKAGKFNINEKRAKQIDACMEEDGCYYGSYLDAIEWTGRIEKDVAGFEVAQKEWAKAYQDARDVIMTSDAATGLDALKEFEGWKHKASKH